MLLDSTDTSLLFLDNLAADQLLASVPRAWRRRSAVGSGGNSRERWKGNSRRGRRKRRRRRALAEVGCERAAAVVGVVLVLDLKLAFVSKSFQIM